MPSPTSESISNLIIFAASSNDIELKLKEERVRELADCISKIGHNKSRPWSPPTPSSNAYVWRYLNFTQLLSILERNEIWMNNVNRFDDPYEGTIPISNLVKEINRIAGDFDIDKEDVLDIYQTASNWAGPSVASAYVSCWNVNEHQSAALWEQYVDAQEGIAIRTTVDRLRRALKREDREFTMGNISYINYDSETIPDGYLPAIYHKRQSFEHENEFRISYMPEDKNEFPNAGFYSEVDKNALIESVVISPIAPDWFSDLVRRVLHRYQLNCNIIKSDLYSDPEIDIE